MNETERDYKEQVLIAKRLAEHHTIAFWSRKVSRRKVLGAS